MKLAHVVFATLAFGAFGSAQADENYACRVIMCLANPEGPTSADTCPPAVSRFYRDMSRGKPLPTCALVGPNGESGTLSLSVHQERFKDCPSGLVPVKGMVMKDGDRNAWLSGKVSTDDNGRTYGPRACVGSQVSAATAQTGDGESIPVQVFDEVVRQEPQLHRVITLLENGAAVRRIE